MANRFGFPAQCSLAVEVQVLGRALLLDAGESDASAYTHTGAAQHTSHDDAHTRTLSTIELIIAMCAACSF